MSALSQIFRAIKQFASTSREQEEAAEKARLLSERIDLSRYTPTNIARTVTFTPPAQRGFSESMLPFYPNFGATLISPSEWAKRTPPLNEPRDERIIQKLQASLKGKGLVESPSVIMTELPGRVEVEHEGRHRMRALERLYGDDPVLVNMVMGNKYNTIEPGDPLFRPGTELWDYQGRSKLSPLELFQREVMFGDKPWDFNPLWIRGLDE